MTTPVTSVPQNDSERWAMLHTAHRDYRATVSPEYDEALYEVAQRFETNQSIGKVEIGGLLLWKRIQANASWAMDLMNLSDKQVREQTRNAYLAANDVDLSVSEAARAARSALGSLPGFVRGDALASAVLLSAAPQRLAVYDSRADRALERLGLELKSGRGRYSRYMTCVEQLRDLARANGESWIARDVDLALYRLGKNR